MLLSISTERISPRYYPFYLFVLMYAFILVADALMSYIAPVVMDRSLHSQTLMGLILSTSSMFGMFFDFFFAKTFGNKRSLFFTRIVLALVLFFPISFLIYRNIPSFVFAMFVWGMYYEGIVFSNFHAIHELVDHHDHLWAWSVLAMCKNVAVLVGPLVAGFADAYDQRLPFYIAIFFYVMGFLFFIVRRLLVRAGKISPILPPQVQRAAHSFREELAIWKGYGVVLWPLLFLWFLLVFVDATFFSIGTVFAENLGQLHPYGGLFLTMYTLPNVLFAVSANVTARWWGKKRSAFLFGLLAGVGFVLMGRVSSVPLILLFTFLGSVGTAITFPEISAIFEDYVARAKHFGNDIVGLSAIMSSTAYVLGPMLDGFLADRIGTQAVFALLGVSIAAFSFLCFFIVKRKIRLPTASVEIALSQVRKTER